MFCVLKRLNLPRFASLARSLEGRAWSGFGEGLKTRSNILVIELDGFECLVSKVVVVSCLTL